MCIINNNKIGEDFRKATDELLKQLKDAVDSERQNASEPESIPDKPVPPVPNYPYYPQHGHTTCPGCKRCFICGREEPHRDYTITCGTSSTITNTSASNSNMYSSYLNGYYN